MNKEKLKESLTLFLKNFPKVLYFPIILLIPLFLLCAFGINGSSIGTFNEALYGNAGNNKLFGENKWIRSDEYLATTPVVLSVVKNNFPEVNKDIGTGIELGIQANIPTGNLFSIFKPPTWLFYLQNNIDVGFAFFWWFRAYLLIIGTYLLIYELTKGDLVTAILGGFIFYFTPFVQWWSNYELIAYAAIIIYSFIKLLISHLTIKSTVFAILFYIFSVSFVLILYPPFQIVIVWTSISVIVGYILSNIKTIKNNTKIRENIILLVLTLLLILVTVLSFYLRYKGSILSIMNTSYPGVRSYTGGSFDEKQIFNGFYNILLLSDHNGVPLGQHNQSEASSFLLYTLPLLLYVGYKSLLTKKKKEKDLFLIVVLSWVVFLIVWANIGFPPVISKITFLFMVPPYRTIIGIGFGSYLLAFYFISLRYNGKENTLIPIILSIAWGILIFFLGINFYSGNPNFLTKPEIFTPEFKLALVLGFTSITTYFLLRRYKILFLICILSYSIASTALINPLYRGVDSIDQTPISYLLNKYPSDSNNKWVVYGDHRFAQYLIGNGQAVLNGIHYYPLFDMWNIIDPKKDYYDIYNRYAHIHFTDNEENPEMVELIYADQINVNMDPCDMKLNRLEVKYYLLSDKKEYSCLKYLESFNTFLRGEMFIYERL